MKLLEITTPGETPAILKPQVAPPLSHREEKAIKRKSRAGQLPRMLKKQAE